ncbi:hypothetical protein NBRC116188_24020 [Oceaniserpentilla sp. 4NH20-0058]|uniref:leucine-rich repeat domain-containing protein n=1 Tax=Oceaniserpentilla sp. 4NH20-0058 TaxID=3127660 RepID=UPI003107DD10
MPACRLTGLFFLLLLLSMKANSLELAVKDRFLQGCLETLAKDHGWVQLKDVTAIKCHSLDIQSLAGLEQFTGLESLSLYNNRIVKLDVDFATLKHLTHLNLARNHLKTVNISGLLKLKKLYLFDNQLTNVTLSQLPELTEMKANNNKIQRFIYQGTPKLEKIYIFNNQLETVDIHHLPSLHYMDCRQNPMPDTLYDEMDKQENVSYLHDGNAEDW